MAYQALNQCWQVFAHERFATGQKDINHPKLAQLTKTFQPLILRQVIIVLNRVIKKMTAVVMQIKACGDFNIEDA